MYKVVRCYRDHSRRTIATGLSLAEAQAHCNDPETSSATCTSAAGVRRTRKMGPWFDAYVPYKERGRKSSAGRNTPPPPPPVVVPADRPLRRRVEILAPSDGGYFKRGQFGYVIGGAFQHDLTGEMCYTVSKTEDMRGGAIPMPARALRFTRSRRDV